jgi:hypothetical protein
LAPFPLLNPGIKSAIVISRNKPKVFFLMYSLFISEGSIAGGTAGVVVETALYPIDTIKTRLQVNMFFRTMQVNLFVPLAQ